MSRCLLSSCEDIDEMMFNITRKYPLHGYILGTALDWLRGGDETLTIWFKNWVYASRHRLGGIRVTQDAYFSLLTHTKQLLFVTFCDTLAGIEVSFWTDGRGSRNSYLDLKSYQRAMWQVRLHSHKYCDKYCPNFITLNFVTPRNWRKKCQKVENGFFKQL